MKTFLLELREAARRCSNPDYRDMLKRSADRIEECIDFLVIEPTTDNMVKLNGAWSRATAVLSALPPEAEPTPPQSAAGELEEPVRMAA